MKNFFNITEGNENMSQDNNVGLRWFEAFVSFLSSAKWFLLAGAILFGGYYFVYQPYQAAKQAAGAVVETVVGAKDGIVDGVKDGTGAAVAAATGYHDIVMTDPLAFGNSADAAFAKLIVTKKSESPGMLNGPRFLAGAENKVCSVTVDFGSGDKQVFVAADNKAYAKAHDLGDQNAPKTIRMFLPGAKVGFNAAFDMEGSAWAARWNITTTTKPIGDEAATIAVEKVLAEVPGSC